MRYDYSVVRIVLVIPPFLPGYSHSSRSPAVARSGTFYYPIWLAYGAASLEDAGHSVRIVDAPAECIDAQSAQARVASFRPELIVVDIATPSAESDLRFAADAESIAPVIVGGVHVGSCAAAVREKLPNATLVTSDYDDALPAACSNILRGDRSEPIHLPASNLDGRTFVSDIYRRHLDVKNYFYACTRYPFVSILGARGCPYECVFCHWPATLSGSAYRLRSAGDIVDEMLFIEKSMSGVREIFFEDDTFNIDERVVADRCEAMIKAGVRIPWSANVRPKCSREILVLMKQAGCRLALVGYESCDDSVLRGVGKRTTEEDQRRFAENARTAGLLVHGCFILGLPGETRETLQTTARVAITLDPDTAQFYPYMPYAGTPGARRGARYDGLLSEDGRHRFGGSDLPGEEVERACDLARRTFYMRPKYALRKALQSVSSPEELVRNFKAFRKFLPAIART